MRPRVLLWLFVIAVIGIFIWVMQKPKPYILPPDKPKKEIKKPDLDYIAPDTKNWPCDSKKQKC